MIDTQIDRTFDSVALDSTLAALQAKKDEWATLSVAQKLALLLQLRDRLRKHAQRWVDVSLIGKQLPPDSPLAGEEWSSGPWAMAESFNALIDTLKAIRSGTTALPEKLRTRPDGQLIAEVFPKSNYDKLLVNGVSAEIWFDPIITEENLADHTALFYKQEAPSGKVALVLGAGNINSIAPLDSLYKLFADGEVVILKMNPVNDYLGPVLADIFKPFIDANYFAIVYGGGDVGAYLTEHDAVDSIHITGAARTHDIIVYGAGEEGATRKAANEPKLSKPITSELGGIGGVIVVPGPWDEEDILFQAERIASQKLHNAGCNCIAAQVLILPHIWEKSGALLRAVKQQFTDLPERPKYYPGAEQRLQDAIDGSATGEIIKGRGLITDIDPNDLNHYCFHDEFFTMALAQTYLEGVDLDSYMRNAIDFVNDTLDGTLGVQLIIHPKTIKELGPRFEEYLAVLRYGTIGVNIWSGTGFLMPHVAWGAYPGHTLDDIQSGVDVVHNAYLFDKTQKNVLYGPFWESPRAIKHGSTGLLPRPPWFVTNKTSATTMRLMTEFSLDQKVTRLPGIFASALRG